MSKFEDHLWREVVRQHGPDLELAGRPPATHRRRARAPIFAGSTIGLAGVGTALALVLGAASSSPAFAVTRNHDGTVQVRILRSAGIAGANAKLSALGVRARIVEVAAGCVIAPWRLEAKPQATRALLALQARIDPRKIPAGQTLVIASWRADRKIHVAPARLVPGAAPACLPPPPRACGPALAPAPSGNSGNSGAGPTGNSGPATTGNSGLAPTGSSGSATTGNSGLAPTGNGGSGGLQGASSVQVPVRCRALHYIPRPPGNSGNSGNSGSSGNS